MRKRKLGFSFFIILCVASMTGCEKVSTISEKNNVSAIQLSGEDELDVSQSYFDSSAHPIAKAEAGYYYVDDFLLRYYDNGTKSSIPLCTKANCDHSQKDCMAWIDSKGIYYYEGYLYYVKINAGIAVLERMEKDGSNRKDIAELCHTSGRVPNVTFCDGYAYYNPEESLSLSEEERTISIQRVSVNGGTSEKIYEYTGINPAISEIKCYGDQLYMVLKEYIGNESDTGELKSKGIISINSKSGESKIVMEGNINSYCIDSNKGQLYYFTISDGLYRYDLSLKESKLLMQATDQCGMCNLSFDGDNIYMNNLTWKRQCRTFLKLDINVVGTIWIYDQEDHLKKEINTDELHCTSIFYGDSSRLFIQSSSLNGESGMFYQEKEHIGDETWIKL